MRVIIAGGRDYKPSNYERELVKVLLDDLGATEVVSGHARGVDKWGERIGKELGLVIKIFEADWSEQGNSAGPIRNRQMAKYSDVCIVLTGGRGTNNMYEQATRLNLKRFDLRESRRISLRVFHL